MLSVISKEQPEHWQFSMFSRCSHLDITVMQTYGMFSYSNSMLVSVSGYHTSVIILHLLSVINSYKVISTVVSGERPPH